MSRLPFELLLALRYLRPKRTFVSVITLIPVLGVMLVVAVLIVVISVMTGFDQELRNRILGFKSHLTVREQTEAALQNFRELIPLIASNANVKSVAPFVMSQVLVRTQPTEGTPRTAAPYVRGIDPKLETNSFLLTSLVAGTNDLRGRGLVVGRVFAQIMRLQIGDTLAVYSIRDLEKMENALKKARVKGEVDEGYLPTDYEVRGIFDAGYYEFDSSFVVCSLANAQDLFSREDAVDGLLVMLHHPERARAVRTELERDLGPGLDISTWEEESSQILNALIVEKNVMFYLLFFIMIVAAFCITSALITFVIQKTREIGVVKALGASSGQIMRIFLSQSLLVGFIGVLAGLGLGVLLVHYRNPFLLFMRKATGWELFPVEIYQFTELPALITQRDVTFICAGALLSCLIAGLLPAWIAGRLKPVEALRHE